MPVSPRRYLRRESCFHELQIANKIAPRKEAAKFPSFLIYILVSRNRPPSLSLSFAAAVSTMQAALYMSSPMYELKRPLYRSSSSALRAPQPPTHRPLKFNDLYFIFVRICNNSTYRGTQHQSHNCSSIININVAMPAFGRFYGLHSAPR